MTQQSSGDTFTFAWQGRGDDFLGWLLPTLMVGTNPKTMEHLSELTDTWRDVKLGVTVNGVAIDPRHFVQSLERNLTHLTQEAAREFLNENCGLQESIDALALFEKGLRRRIERKARELGVDLSREKDW